MDGEIFLRSALGKGTTFIVQIPQIITSEEISSDKGEQDTESLVDTIPELRILLVEDNEVNRSLASAILVKLGHDVTTAENGLKGMEMAKKGNFDLIFMDMQMPVMDGITATQKIIESLGDDSPPIVALTANIFEENRNEAMAAGMVGFITKPFRKKDLIGAIQTHYRSQGPKKAAS